MGLYSIETTSDGVYQLFEGNTCLGSFSRSSFREQMEVIAGGLGRSSHWIGNILVLFNRLYPSPVVKRPFSKNEYLHSASDDTLMNHLKSKGFRVYRSLPVSDVDIVQHLESRGYLVEGLVEDAYYHSEGSTCVRK